VPKNKKKHVKTSPFPLHQATQKWTFKNSMFLSSMILSMTKHSKPRQKKKIC